MKSVFSLVALFLCGCCLQAQQKNVVSILRILDIGTTGNGWYITVAGNFIGYRQKRRRSPYLSTAVSPIAVITIM